MRVVHVLNLLLLAGLFAGSAWAWPHLPASYPIHFDFQGRPDGWTEKSFWSWFLLPVVGLAMGALFYGLGRWIPRHPRLVNLPRKKKFLALSPEAQAPVVAIIVALLHWSLLVVLAIFASIQYGIWAAAQGDHQPVALIGTTVLSLVVIPILVVVSMVKTTRAIDRASAEAERSSKRSR